MKPIKWVPIGLLVAGLAVALVWAQRRPAGTIAAKDVQRFDRSLPLSSSKVINVCQMTQTASNYGPSFGLWKKFPQEDVRDCFGADVAAHYRNSDRLFWSHRFVPDGFRIDGGTLWVSGKDDPGSEFRVYLLPEISVTSITRVRIMDQTQRFAP